jgi:hypothetical protein
MNDFLLKPTRVSRRDIGAPEQAEEQYPSRVTLEDIEANIVEEWYFTAWDGAQLAYWGSSDPANPKPVEGQPDRDGPLGRIIFCVLVLKEGLTVTGDSTCVGAEDFDAEMGRKLAREAAIGAAWSLMTHALTEGLDRGQRTEDGGQSVSGREAPAMNELDSRLRGNDRERRWEDGPATGREAPAD